MTDEMGRIPTGSGGDDGKWMARFTEIPDAEVDALLQGVVPDDGDDLAPIAELAAALRHRVAEEPVPPMNPALRAQISGGNVVPLDRARLVRRPLIGAAAAAAVVLATLVAGASQEVLPERVQRVVASVAERLGIDLPHPDDDIESQPVRSEGSPPETTPGGATPADPGAPGGPATPADPADGQGSGGGQGGNPGQDANPGLGQGSGPGEGDSPGTGQDGSPGAGQGSGGGQGSGEGRAPDPPSPPGNNASGQGQQSGTGNSGADSSASGQGQEQGTGTAKGGPKG